MAAAKVHKADSPDNEKIIIMPRAAKPTLAGRPKPAPRPLDKQ